jgi:hypothetical protein
MRSKTLGVGFRVALVAVALAVPSTALAHIRWMTPTPRSQADGLKPPTYPAPCGNVAKGATPQAVFASGATISVKWAETVPHEGCYQVAFSADDVNWVMLKQVVDPPTANVTVFNETVTLPAGVSCMNCTLQLRQIMLGAGGTCAPDAAPPNGTVAGAGNTYYSCADICVVAFFAVRLLAS